MLIAREQYDDTRHTSERGSAVAAPPLAWVATLMGWMGEAFRLSERSIGPVVDLLIQLLSGLR